MKILNLGLMAYADALQKMEQLHTKVSQTPGHTGYLIVVEHPPTVTMGYRENTHDLLLTPDGLQSKNIDYFKIDRGGSVTVHEPGQCVVYPIFNLFEFKLTVRSYVTALEEAMILTCKQFQVNAHRDCENPGIWVGNNKIGAVGIRILRKVTKHGIAFNINNDLKTFSFVVPCGLRFKGVTTLSKEVLKINPQSNPLNFKAVSDHLVQNLLHQLNQTAIDETKD